MGVIVSHRHRFIFLKTVKTAGTSIEIALSRHCGPDDIITPIAPPEDEVTRTEQGGLGPQNYRDAEGQVVARNHMRAKAVRRLVGTEVWDRYFKFTVERNPFDAVVSLYWFLHRDSAEDQRPSLSDFVQGPGVERLLRSDQIYRINDQVAVDRVCRYEQLEENLGEVWERIGLPGAPELPRAKGGFRQDRRHYRELYTPADAARVGALFARPILEFGYAF